MQTSALIAMSGGVDSSVAALLSVRDGLECAGATAKLHINEKSGEPDAREAAGRLGIPYYIFDFSESFKKLVIERFIAVYREGRTPNPCIECNRFIKFGCFMQKSTELGKDLLVTGHYARAEMDGAGRYLLKKGADLSKDQSYVLYTLKQEQLSRVHFPLGGLLKSEVRDIAREAGLANAGISESQDICFVPGGDYARFINEHTGAQPQKGRFVDTLGNDLGENDGLIKYTVGQRRGLGLAMPYPPYVLELRPEDNTVVVGKDEMLYSKSFHVNDVNLIAFEKIDSPMRVRVKIRYKHAEQPATVRQISDSSLFIEFDEPQRAITKGQAAVMYDGDVVLGGGTIV